MNAQMHAHKDRHGDKPYDALDPLVLAVQEDHLRVCLPRRAEDCEVFLCLYPCDEVGDKLTVRSCCSPLQLAKPANEVGVTVSGC